MSGMGTMRLDDSEAPVRAGDCVVIAPGAVHKLLQPGYRAARAALLLRARLLPRGHRPHGVLSRRAPPALRRARGDRAARPAVRGERRAARSWSGSASRPGDLQRARPGSSSARATSATSWPGTRCDVQVAARRDRRATWRRRENAGARVLLGFSHSRSRCKRAARRCPSPRRFRREFLRFRARYPLVKTYLTWNEANHRGQPTWNHPERRRPLLRHPAPQLPRAARSSGRPCSTRRRCRAGCKQVEQGRQAPDRDLGAPQLHRRQPLPHARHALAAARARRGEDLVHRDRRAGAARQRLADRVRRVAEARGRRRRRQVVKLAAPEPARPARLLLPLEPRPRRTPTWDSALIDRARPPAPRLHGRASTSSAGCGAATRLRARRGAPRGEAAGARARARGRSRSPARPAAATRESIRGGGTTGRQDADGLLVAAEPGERRLARHRRRREARARRGARARSARTRSTSPRSTRAAPARATAPRGGEAARDAMADTQTSAVIGTVDSDRARAPRSRCSTRRGSCRSRSAPATPASPAASGPGEPERWQPVRAGARFARLVGDDRAQARALVRAAGTRRDRGRGRGRRRTPRRWRAEVRRAAAAAGAKVVAEPGRDGAVDLRGRGSASNAAERRRRASRARRPARASCCPTQLVRARRRGAARRPRGPAAPCSSRARPSRARRRRCGASRPAFERTFGRRPGPYAALGYAAMATVLAALAERGADERRRRARRVIDAYFAAAERRGDRARRLRARLRAADRRPRASAPSACAAAGAEYLPLGLERRVQRDLRTPASARETGQLSFAASAAFWKPSSSRPGTRARRRQRDAA